MNTRSERVRGLLPYILPTLFLFAVYWYGLKCWFEQDDFAWLGLHAQVTDWRSFWAAMFTPYAQGTIRPWSERGFFLLFYKLFQSNALPYHIFVFVSQTANLVLLSLIFLKLTRSRLAALAAPILWTANSALLTPLCWASDYNQIQCAFFLLLAFYLYLQDRYWLQFAVFVLGFGALELNIVYPALVLAYVVTCRCTLRRALQTIPLFAVSLAYYLLHSAAAPRQSTGVYALHVDSALPRTFWTYWSWSFAHPNSQHLAVVLVFTAAVLGFVSYEFVKGRRLPLFFLLWYVITLAPLLPLRDHISNYYLAIPTLGLASIGACALARALLGAAPVRARLRLASIPTLLIIGFYLAIQIPVDRLGTHWYLNHSRAVRNLVTGVRHARQIHPGATLLLTDVSPDLYADSIAHSVFRTLDIPDVYLAPEAIAVFPKAEEYILPIAAVRRALTQEKLQVYSAAPEHIRNITSAYEHSFGSTYSWNEKNNIPRRVDVGSPLLAYLLGSTWYPPEAGFRWMPSRASLRMGGPSAANATLTLNGYCPPEQTQSGPLTIFVSVDGEKISEAKLSRPETSFSRTFVLPAAVAGRDSVEVTVAVDRTLQKPAGSRPLGLAFGVFEIR
ncbi:MAG: hypothetical protein M3Z09_00890 [Acidobacteriota bacterium]|nr:hypothetical protein [Acidobacteriota bacterium]